MSHVKPHKTPMRATFGGCCAPAWTGAARRPRVMVPRNVRRSTIGSPHHLSPRYYPDVPKSGGPSGEGPVAITLDDLWPEPHTLSGRAVPFQGAGVEGPIDRLIGFSAIL